jgi:hypothetical protein
MRSNVLRALVMFRVDCNGCASYLVLETTNVGKSKWGRSACCVLSSVSRVLRYSRPEQLTTLSESLETMHVNGVCYGVKTLRDMLRTDMLTYLHTE